jgi:hypothetical protein
MYLSMNWKTAFLKLIVITALATVIVTAPLTAQTASAGTQLTWTARQYSDFYRGIYASGIGMDTIRAVAYGGNQFLAGGLVGYLFVSPDGVDWTVLDMSTIYMGTTNFNTNTYQTTNDSVMSIRYLEGKFFVGGRLTSVRVETNPWEMNSIHVGRLIYSTNGRTHWMPARSLSSRTQEYFYVNDSWFGVNRNFDFGHYVKDIAYGDGYYVLAGRDLYYSSNGIEWSSYADWYGDNYNGVAFGGGRFVIVKPNGVIANARPTGDRLVIENENRSIFGDSPPSAVAYGGGRFVVVGNDGKIAYSTDGVHWAVATNNVFGTNHIHTVAYGAGMFVAGGDNGMIAYSSDGRTWVRSADSGFGTNRILSITYGYGRFVAVGQSSFIAYSNQLETPVITPQPVPPQPGRTTTTPSSRPDRSEGRPEVPETPAGRR